MTGSVTAWLRRRLAAARDDRGSLPLALLLIMVGLALAAALLPTMIVQDRATVFDGTRMDNLAAAQAGVDVVVGDIRAATITAGIGTAAKLPCTTPNTPITGPVNGTGGKATYSAVVSYFVLDPIVNPPPPKGTNTAMICVNGAGTYDPTSASYVPSFALITSVGTDGVSAGGGGSTGRTITSTYVFKTSDKNFPSGVIRVFPDGSNNWCMDVGGATPIAGTPVVLQTCSASTPPAAQQLFAYRKDLTLQLSASVSVAAPYGLCLDFNAGSTNPAPAAKNKDPVRLQPCADLSSSNVPYSQQWSYNDNGGFTASNADSVQRNDLSNQCIAVENQVAAAPVLLRDCGSQGSTQAWLPAPSVGAGAAADPQLVNFQQFGRCLDVFQQNPDSPRYIAYPCKQNPYPGAVLWNQKFTYDAGTGQLSTVDTNGGTYYNVKLCLYSPFTEGGYVHATPCANPSSTLSAAQLKWTLPGSGPTASSVPYPKRYTYVDGNAASPRCLSIAKPPDGDTSDAAHWYYITVAQCNGSTAQKWNADPSIGAPTLQNLTETTSGG